MTASAVLVLECPDDATDVDVLAGLRSLLDVFTGLDLCETYGPMSVDEDRRVLRAVAFPHDFVPFTNSVKSLMAEARAFFRDHRLAIINDDGHDDAAFTHRIVFDITHFLKSGVFFKTALDNLCSATPIAVPYVLGTTSSDAAGKPYYRGMYLAPLPEPAEPRVLTTSLDVIKRVSDHDVRVY